MTGDKYIILDEGKFESSAERTCIMAEELGLHMTGGTIFLDSEYNDPRYRMNIIKAKGQAKAWGINAMLTATEIQEAIDRFFCYGAYEMAEHLGITLEQLDRAVDYFMSWGFVFVYPEEYA